MGSFPEAIVVDIPDYCGPVFYEGEPTWVPIPAMTSYKEGTKMTRTQFPVVAGFALTVNKAQGLTIKECKQTLWVVTLSRQQHVCQKGMPDLLKFLRDWVPGPKKSGPIKIFA